MNRTVVVTLWTGSVVVQRFGPVERIDDLTDAQVDRALRRVGALDASMEADARRERLRAWPTDGDLDAIATAWTASNEGVRPTVRVLEESGLPGRRLGVAGSTPQ